MRSMTITLVAAPVPVHLGQHQQVGILEVAPQLRAVGGLAHQVELVMQVLVELGHHFARLQAAAVGPQFFQQVGGHLQQRDVVLDDRLDAGAQDLDRHLAAIRQLAKCTWATEAEATGLRSKRAKTWSTGLP
jgi:hypothetical protein